jgi:isopenicillin-N epimerase
MQANRELAGAGRDRLLATLSQPPPAPAEMLGSMAAVVLPDDLPPPRSAWSRDVVPSATYPPDPLHDVLQADHAIEVPVYPWPQTGEHGREPFRLLRISAQVYNSIADYERLAAVLGELRTIAA